MTPTEQREFAAKQRALRNTIEPCNTGRVIQRNTDEATNTEEAFDALGDIRDGSVALPEVQPGNDVAHVERRLHPVRDRYRLGQAAYMRQYRASKKEQKP